MCSAFNLKILVTPQYKNNIKFILAKHKQNSYKRDSHVKNLPQFAE